VFGTDGGRCRAFSGSRLSPVTLVIAGRSASAIWIDDVVRAVRLAVHGEQADGPVSSAIDQVT
jgi:hypothetical protein